MASPQDLDKLARRLNKEAQQSAPRSAVESEVDALSTFLAGLRPDDDSTFGPRVISRPYDRGDAGVFLNEILSGIIRSMQISGLRTDRNTRSSLENILLSERGLLDETRFPDGPFGDIDFSSLGPSIDAVARDVAETTERFHAQFPDFATLDRKLPAIRRAQLAEGAITQEVSRAMQGLPSSTADADVALRIMGETINNLPNIISEAFDIPGSDLQLVSRTILERDEAARIDNPSTQAVIPTTETVEQRQEVAQTQKQLESAGKVSNASTTVRARLAANGEQADSRLEGSKDEIDAAKNAQIDLVGRLTTAINDFEQANPLASPEEVGQFANDFVDDQLVGGAYRQDINNRVGIKVDERFDTQGESETEVNNFLFNEFGLPKGSFTPERTSQIAAIGPRFGEALTEENVGAFVNEKRNAEAEKNFNVKDFISANAPFASTATPEDLRQVENLIESRAGQGFSREQIARNLFGLPSETGGFGEQPSFTPNAGFQSSANGFESGRDPLQSLITTPISPFSGGGDLDAQRVFGFRDPADDLTTLPERFGGGTFSTPDPNGPRPFTPGRVGRTSRGGVGGPTPEPLASAQAIGGTFNQLAGESVGFRTFLEGELGRLEGEFRAANPENVGFSRRVPSEFSARNREINLALAQGRFPETPDAVKLIRDLELEKDRNLGPRRTTPTFTSFLSGQQTDLRRRFEATPVGFAENLRLRQATQRRALSRGRPTFTRRRF